MARFSSPPFREMVRLLVPAVLALIVLNIGLTHHNIWPTPWIRVTNELSLELVVLALGLTAAATFGVRIGPRTQWALAILVFLFVLGRYADVTAPALFGRRIDLYWDTQHVPAVAAMIVENWLPMSIALLLGSMVGAFAFLLMTIRYAMGVLCRAVSQATIRRCLAVAGGLLLAVYVAGMNSDALNWERRFAIPIAPVYVSQAAAIFNRVAGPAHAGDQLAQDDRPLRPFAELSGRDIFVIFLESYGRVALDDDAYTHETRKTLAALEEQLSQKGWQSRSAYLTAPTFGGASWLSHASLLSGYTVSTHDIYEAFLHATNEQLADRFRRSGYRSVLLAPGIRGPWPAGLAMRFDRILVAEDIAYDGPGFGWWYIPDQISLDRLHRLEIDLAERPPLFVMFPTIMSHFPFGPTPPYVEDVAMLASDMPFEASAVDSAIALGDALTGDRQKAYLRAILYDLKTVAGFVAERAPEDSIVIAIGDHQPPAAISGEDTGWDVPIHVFARNTDVLNPFESAGLIHGAIPQGESAGRIDELTSLLLEALEIPILQAAAQAPGQ